MGNTCFRNQSDNHPIDDQPGDYPFDSLRRQRPDPRQARPYPDRQHHNPREEITQETVIVRALYNYVARTSDDLPFELGEELDVEKRYTNSGRDWWFARSRRTGRTGYIPRNYVADITSLEAEP